MNIHKNAKTTPKMRGLIVERRQAGETPRSIASAVGVSPATVSKWLRRFGSEGVATPTIPVQLPLPHLVMPIHHDIRTTDVLTRAFTPIWLLQRIGVLPTSPNCCSFQVSVRGRYAALAMVAEVMHGAPCRFTDPARFSSAHGGHPLGRCLLPSARHAGIAAAVDEF